MELLILSIAYVAIHFVVYVGMVRGREVGEAGLLLFHAASFLVLSAAMIGFTLFSASSGLFAGAVAGIAIHVIYSLSFLELWALSDGSLSLPILDDVARSGPLTRQEIVARHQSTGDDRKLQRMESLMRLHLAGKDAGDYRLTRRGRLLAAFFAALVTSAGIRGGG